MACPTGHRFVRGPHADIFASSRTPHRHGRGGVAAGSNDTVLTAPSDQDLVVTDVVLNPDVPDSTCELIMRAQLILGSGDEVARYTLTFDCL